MPIAIFNPGDTFQTGKIAGRDGRKREEKEVLEKLYEEKPEFKEAIREFISRLDIPDFLKQEEVLEKWEKQNEEKRF